MRRSGGGWRCCRPASCGVRACSVQLLRPRVLSGEVSFRPLRALGAALPSPATRGRGRLGWPFVSAWATWAASRRVRCERWSPSASPAGRGVRLADLAGRSGASAETLGKLAWAGACDALVEGLDEEKRRRALWTLGVAVPGVAGAGGDAAVAAARSARGAGAAGVDGVGADAGRLWVDRGDVAGAPARADAAGSARGPADERAARASSGRAAGCVSRGSSWRASGPRPRRASPSCCSRTSTGRST